MAPSFVNSTEACGNPFKSAMASYRLDRAHQVHEPVSLERAVALEIRRRGQDQALDLTRLADELPACGKERRDDAGHVRRRHARAALLEIQPVHACGPGLRELAARRAGDDLLPRSEQIRLGPAITARSL